MHIRYIIKGFFLLDMLLLIIMKNDSALSTTSISWNCHLELLKVPDSFSIYLISTGISRGPAIKILVLNIARFALFFVLRSTRAILVAIYISKSQMY